MNERQIRAWMILNKLTPKKVAQSLGISDTAVYRFLNGTMASARINGWFRRKGCPAAYLKSTNTRRAA